VFYQINENLSTLTTSKPREQVCHHDCSGFRLLEKKKYTSHTLG